MGIDRARLPARHELKYYINPAELEALGRRLERVMRLDSHLQGAAAPTTCAPCTLTTPLTAPITTRWTGVMARDKYRLRI